MHMPAKCQTCYKYYRDAVDKNCPICREIAFPERLLCNLIREAQAEIPVFDCAAFRPNLAVVNSPTIERRESFREDEIQHDIQRCAKVKWLRACASQQVHVAPGNIVYDIKLHYCVITWRRKPLFTKKTGYAANVSEIVTQSGDFFPGAVYLLGVGVDHLHIYVDSTPDDTVEAVAQNIMAATARRLIETFPDLGADGEPIFETSYFAETIGKDLSELPPPEIA